MKVPDFLKNKDVLGWLVWMLLTLLLLAPCIYGAYQVTYDTASTLTRVVAGVFAAAIAAGFISWIGNEIWFRLRLRKYAARKKSARKAKRKNK